MLHRIYYNTRTGKIYTDDELNDEIMNNEDVESVMRYDRPDHCCYNFETKKYYLNDKRFKELGRRGMF